MGKNDKKGKAPADPAPDTETAAPAAADAPAPPAPPPPPDRHDVAHKMKAVTLGCVSDLTLSGAHALVVGTMLAIIVAHIVTLALSPGDGWGLRPSLLGDDTQATWGYVDYNGPVKQGRLASTLGVASQVFGALACAAICISILAAIYVLHSSFMFLRGWYEAAHAAGGTRAALPAFAVGAHTLIWAGLFYGVSQSFVWRGATDIVPTGRRLRPGWAWYTTLGCSLAWLLAAHTLSRMPPLELVRSWMGDTAPKVKPLLGGLPAGLRASLQRTSGVEVV